MNVLLVSIGSHGDVHPFVGLAQALQRRGHDVRLALNRYFEPLARQAGLDTLPLGEPEQFTRWLDDPAVFHPRKGGAAVLRGTAESLRVVYDGVAAAAARRPLVVASSLGLGARVAAEKFDLPMATAHLAPICIRSHHVMPRLPGAPPLDWLPMWARRKFWEGADRFFIDPPIAPALNRLRADVGLAPVTRVLGDYWNSPMLTLGFWPDWFSPPPPDWPKCVRLVGFPLYDEADVTPLEPALGAFLDAGDPPIAFTPGSAMKFGHRFFQAAADACAALGRRGLLLTRHAEQIPARLPAGVVHAPYAPFSLLLPRVAALVHHGGIGTTAQALRAGTPQLIMPLSHDQFDNAIRVRRLDAGREIAARAFTSRRVASALSALLGDRAVAAGCSAAADRFRGVDALSDACDRLEEAYARAVTTR